MARQHASLGPIIVGIERSERSRDALAVARTLARAVGTRLILVSIYPLDARSASVERGAYARALAEEAENTVDRMARLLSGVAAESRAVPCTSVARGLQELATAEGALAIVVGPSHRSGLGRVAPGSVAARLLRSAPCPVAVAPRGYWGRAHLPIRRIGLGFVATPEAHEALGAAVGLAGRTGATIRALRVVEPSPVAFSLPFGWNYAQLEQAAGENLAGSLRRTLDDVMTPVAISSEVVDGYADDELARLSEDVDLLVCGSRGRGPLGQVILGSVSAGLLRKARCPVLIVPRGADDGFAWLQAPATAAAS